jgi:hypothetical protein
MILSMALTARQALPSESCAYGRYINNSQPTIQQCRRASRLSISFIIYWPLHTAFGHDCCARSAEYRAAG